MGGLGGMGSTSDSIGGPGGMDDPGGTSGGIGGPGGMGGTSGSMGGPGGNSGILYECCSMILIGPIQPFSNGIHIIQICLTSLYC